MHRRTFVGGSLAGGLGLAVPVGGAADAASGSAATSRVIPLPHSISVGPRSLRLNAGGGPSIVLPVNPSAKLTLAADLLEAEIGRLAGSAQVSAQRVPAGATVGKSRVAIHLVDSQKGRELGEAIASRLDDEDRKVLADSSAAGQAYVILILPDRNEAWLVGSGAQGVLYAAASLAQWMDLHDGPSLREAHIRDYPDFRFRAASDWLLQAEANRWAYDWGDGRRAYIQRVKRKLDFCLRYKINTVVFDGFGWKSEKAPGYSKMMRELNAYARERGIKLMFGGYGSNYQAALVRPEHNIGTIWHNRESYPHGAVYSCFGEANPTYREGSPTGGLLGTCRGNEELNRLKAEEMRQFVSSVEPGAVYIHHEDVGNIVRRGETGDDNNRLADWRTRCPRCKARWPNDDFLAKDGGSGAMAHGYRNLMKAVFSVRNPDTGYDARRDCTVILVSPGYSPSATDKASWEAHLSFWANVVSLLPDEGNVEICFREVMPQQGSGKRWLDAFHERLAAEGRSFPTFLFFVGGADHYSARSFNYPYSPVAAMNGLFTGAETIYNFCGSVFQEPLQILNSEFAWNSKAPGHRIPATYESGQAARRAMMTNLDVPQGGLLSEACLQLYGKRAGETMLRYMTFFQPQPRAPDGSLMVPVAPERLYATPILWRILELDRDSGSTPPDSDSQRWIGKLRLSPADWQERWSHLWRSYAEVNSEAGAIVNAALRSPDLRKDSLEDVAYLKKCLDVAHRFAGLLAAYHRLLAHRAAVDTPQTQSQVDEVRGMVKGLSDFLDLHFRFDTVDPLGGDQASWLETLDYLRNRLAEFT